MRIIYLIATLLPSMACASDWVELGTTAEARIMLDKESIETFEGGAKASLKILYHTERPGQTVTHGKPFDSSINQYYLVCGTRQYQVLQLTLFHQQDTVGSFTASLNLNNLDNPKLGTGVLLLLNKLCPANKPGTATQTN